VAQAAATINVGAHLLLPNTPNQHVPIAISGTDTNVQGFTLNAQVGDGGPLGGGSAGPGPNGDSAPSFSTGPGAATWTTAGYLFATNNGGISDTNDPPLSNFGDQLISQGTSTLGTSTVSLAGGPFFLFDLVFDTTGWTSVLFPCFSWVRTLVQRRTWARRPVWLS